MAKLETRRINPIGHVTLVAVIILIVFEVLVIGGIFELKAQTVAKYAPWAYEPFLRLVGEHPDSAARWAVVEEADESAGDMLPPETPSLPGTNGTTSATNAVPEDAPVPEVSPTNTPAANPDKFVPVG